MLEAFERAKFRPQVFQMWREESGIVEMLLAYIGEFKEFSGWSNWRNVVVDILSCHEEIRKRQLQRNTVTEQNIYRVSEHEEEVRYDSGKSWAKISQEVSIGDVLPILSENNSYEEEDTFSEEPASKRIRVCSDYGAFERDSGETSSTKLDERTSSEDATKLKEGATKRPVGDAKNQHCPVGGQTHLEIEERRSGDRITKTNYTSQRKRFPVKRFIETEQNAQNYCLVFYPHEDTYTILKVGHRLLPKGFKGDARRGDRITITHADEEFQATFIAAGSKEEVLETKRKLKKAASEACDKLNGTEPSTPGSNTPREIESIRLSDLKRKEKTPETSTPFIETSKKQGKSSTSTILEQSVDEVSHKVKEECREGHHHLQQVELECIRQRKDFTPNFPAMEGSEDYLLLYYVLTKSYSDPIFIGNPCIQMEMPERLLLQRRDFLRVKSNGQSIPAIVAERGNMEEIVEATRTLDEYIDAGMTTEELMTDLELGNPERTFKYSMKFDEAESDSQEVPPFNGTWHDQNIIPHDGGERRISTTKVEEKPRKVERVELARGITKVVDEQKETNCLLRKLIRIQVSEKRAIQVQATRRHTDKTIVDFNGRLIKLDSIHSNDEKLAAWKILVSLMKEEDVLGKIVEPFKQTNSEKIIPVSVTRQIKEALSAMYTAYDWECVRRYINQKIRDKAKKGVIHKSYDH